MTELSGYALEALREDGEFILYRGTRLDDGTHVLVAAPVSEQAEPGTLRRLEHEYSLSGEIDAAWAARPRDLLRRLGRTMLIRDDPGGEPLDRLLGQPLALAQVLRFAIGLARALGKCHERRLIHKDVKPANILVNTMTGEVWLTGFGITSSLPRERQGPQAPEVIAGTLAYMAPEQTGRMNRSVDSRSDLYSLGVTLYEMLTGALPFVASDAMEWVHCHIARHPRPPSELVAEIPEAVSAIVMKLLAKTAEDRYQTAAGLQADLARCLAQWESVGQIEPFPLGAHDASDRLLIPEKLYGREAESKILLDAFDRVVARGTPELVLVSGHSGIGKSSLVNQLHTAIVQPRGIFAAGKFDQYKRNIPFATLGQAFHSVIREILSKSEQEVVHWQDAIQQGVGANGRLITDLIPELELLIGKPPQPPELPPNEAEERFQAVFRGFLSAFAREQHPLALFLDDVQWLDSASLKLLEYLMSHPDVRYLLVIGGCRVNEIAPSHPLVATLNAIRKTRAMVLEIVLRPLSLADIALLVAETLQCDRAKAEPLAELVHEKTAGNPFFAIQFLTELAEEHLLEFEPHRGAWRWDLERIRAKGFTDNVIDLMVGKLNRLPEGTRDALKQLACLGNSVGIAELTRVYGRSEAETRVALWDAVVAGLILKADESYRFPHDRIQEAAYSLIPEGARAETHLQIGRRLLASTPRDSLSERVFEIVSHFNRAAALLNVPDEKILVAELNLRAGRKAQAASAHSSALTYFSAAHALLGPDSWVSHYDLAFAVFINRAFCQWLCGQFDAATNSLDTLMSHARNRLDLIAIYRVRITLHTTRAEIRPAILTTLAACSNLFGIEFPLHPSRQMLQEAVEHTLQQVGGRRIEDLLELPAMADAETQAAVALLSESLPPAYFTDPGLHFLMSCKIVEFSLRYGNTEFSSHGYVQFGTALGHIFHKWDQANRFAKLGCDLIEKHSFITAKPRAYFTAGNFVFFFVQDLEHALSAVIRSFDSALECGDMNHACFAARAIVSFHYMMGRPLVEVAATAERFLDFTRRAKNEAAHGAIMGFYRLVQNLRGKDHSLGSYHSADFDPAAFEEWLEGVAETWTPGAYYTYKAAAKFLSGDYAEACEAASRASRIIGGKGAGPLESGCRYWSALCLAARCDAVTPDQRRRYLNRIVAYRRQFRVWRKHCPSTFLDKDLLLGAEIARLRGRDMDAMRLYEQAINAARDSGFVHNEAIAHERAAIFYADREFDTSAAAHLSAARSCYARWGAEAKVKQLDRLHPELPKQQPLPSTTSLAIEPVQLDALSIMKASQAVSGEIILDKLIETLVVIAVEHAGAERGLLILPAEGDYRVAAEASTGRETVHVTFRQVSLTPSELPGSIFRYVTRTHKSVILDDASMPNPFSADPYLVGRKPKSVFCLPLVKQTKLLGALYLENNLAPRVFTPEKAAVLELLASQAAISLENARLYADLQQENREREQAENALRASEERLSMAQRAAGAVSWEWDFASGAVDWFQTSGHVQGPKSEPPTPSFENFRRMVHPQDWPNLYKEIEQVIATGQPYNTEYRIIRPDGSIRWINGLGRLYYDRDGKPDRMMGINLDITRRKVIEQALVQAKLDAEHANAAKSRFLATASHDLRQPAQSLMLLSATLSQILEGLPAAKVVEHIQKAANALKFLLDGLLDISRLDAGIVEPQIRDISVARLLDQLAQEYRPQAVVKGVELRTMAGQAWVRSDPILLERMLRNVIENAIKYTPKGKIVIGCRRHGDMVQIEVHDTGIGIAADQLDSIFEEYYQIDNPSRDCSKGLGLGLAIVRRLSKLLGHPVQVRSIPGRGSSFTMTLGAGRPQSLPGVEDQLPTRSASSGLVVVVDDDQQVQAALRMTLEAWGYEVVAGNDDSEILAQLADRTPDVLFVDFRLRGGLTGVQVLHQIGQALGRKLCGVLLTGDTAPERIVEAKRSGFGILHKPITADTLRGFLDSLRQPSTTVH